ncbi:MAG TPA: NAD(P)-binding domain-containing protein [Candidatus Xenobia bacterium]|nr:NAD(P)-binding domain-containing protein [Candidatus Xenobia bacterium]
MSWFNKPGSVWDMGPRFPVLDGNRQSSIPGLYLAGDVTGTPDIKAAINAGAEVARHILSQDLKCKPPCDAHVIIIGGGPAGVSAALEFEKQTPRLRSGQAPRSARADSPFYLLLEKKRLFATLHGWAKSKPLFYASTGDPDVRGELWWQEPSARAPVRTGDLLDLWQEQLQQRSLNVRSGETVTDIQKTDRFRVVTDKGSYICDRVILCIGKLIYLLKLEVGAEAEPKVFYERPDPAQVRDRDVLVVGSTNEALEAAATLAATNRVTLAHQTADLNEAEPEAVEALRAARVNHLPGARVKQVERDAVVVETPQAPALRLKNDLVFALLGVDKTELPIGFFRKIHIAYERDWDWKRYGLFLLSIVAVGAFYLLKKFMPGVVMVPAPAWLGLPGNEWDLGSLYPLIYTVVVAAFGVRTIRRWKKARWRVLESYGGQQTLRLASLIFFQTVFFFLVPLFIVKDWRAWGLLYPWPLVFNPVTLPHFQASPFWWWWSLGLVFIAVPVAVYFHGKKYCTWVCGCGGLAETLGDSWRHYSPKGVGNTRKERQIYFVTGFAAVATVLGAAGRDFALAGITLSRVYEYTVDLFLIAIIPVALYAFMGGKIWCRYWCPVVGWMNAIEWGLRKLRRAPRGSQFQISADKHRCITCNLCTRYCEVGVDVMRHAVKGESFGMWNSSCVGCGICIHVCPTDVLTFGHHQLVTLPSAPPLKRTATT